MSKRPRVYAIMIQGHKQIGVDIGAICWGSCGKGAIGAIAMQEWGDATPCVVPAAECPNLDRQQRDSCGSIEFNGKEYDVVLRKLKASAPPAAPKEEAK